MHFVHGLKGQSGTAVGLAQFGERQRHLVAQDIAAIKRSVRAKELKDVTSNCSGLVFDTGTSYGNLPAPDNTLTNELNVAYEDFVSAGSSCAAAGTLNSGRITSALATIALGVVSLDRATRILAADGVH